MSSRTVYKGVGKWILLLFVVAAGSFLAAPGRAFATTCANNGTVVTFYDNGANRCIGVITSGSGNMQLPYDWSNTNQIEVIGAGGKGAARRSASRGGPGGGSGAYGIVSNTSSLTGGSSYKYNVGAANTGTSLATTQGSWFCSDTSCANVSDTNTIVGAESGAAALTTAVGAAGNAGTNKLYNGAAGIAPAAAVAAGGGGGGAAGPNGAGSAGSGATGGKADNNTVNAGASGTEYTINAVTYGSGGGGAGGNTGSGSGGGNYGSGGGGAGDSASGNTGAAGVGGLIVITYTPLDNPPSVTTNSISPGVTSAALSGQITATGGALSSTVGFAWGTSSTLQSSGVFATTSTSGSFGVSTFTQAVSGLISGTTYYYRAYATNTNGTGYGNILNFTAGSNTTPARAIRLFSGFTVRIVGGIVSIH